MCNVNVKIFLIGFYTLTSDKDGRSCLNTKTMLILVYVWSQGGEMGYV